MKVCGGKLYNGPEKRFVRCERCNTIDWEHNEGDLCTREFPTLKEAVAALFESERHPADYYVETQPTCPWCERGALSIEEQSSFLRGEGGFHREWTPQQIRHADDCPWAAMVQVYELEEKDNGTDTREGK